MKRFCAGLLAFCLVMTCGCSGGGAQKPIMYVDAGAYNLTPQEFIDLINQTIAEQDNTDYKAISDFEESGKTINIGGIHSSICFSTNTEGKISEIKYEWNIYNFYAEEAAFLVGVTIQILSPKNAQTVLDELKMMDLSMQKPGHSSYETSYSIDESDYEYFSFGDGKYNWLTIHPSEGK